MMKVNRWTLGLAAVGLVTIPAAMQAEEKMGAVNTALSSTTLSGYVDTSAHWAIGNGHLGNGTSYAPPAYAFNTANKQDGFNLNVVNVSLEKPLDAQDNWAAGYKVETIYGPNAVGWNRSIGGNNAQNSDFGLKQAYVALRAPIGNGLDFKVGVFDTIIGYEVFNAGSNPNYTRSWGYTIEPTQHTGLLASYQFCKEIGLAVGVANTANAGINNRSFLNSKRGETDKTYMAALTLTAPDSFGVLAGSTAYVGVVNGWNTGIRNSSLQDNILNVYAGATLNTGLKGLKVGAAYDHVRNSASPEGNVSKAPKQYYIDTAALYLSFQATEKLSLHGRGEYLWSNLPKGVLAGMTRDMVALTGTIQYDLWANVLSRLEIRWDHSLNARAGSGSMFYDHDKNSLLLAANIIYKF